MIARLCLPVIATLIALGGIAASQQSAPLPSGPQRVQSAPVPSAEQNKATKDKQEAGGNAAVQHGADKPPDHQSSGRDRTSGSDGERVGHFSSYTPEEVTALFTIALAIATFALVVATIVLAVATIGLYKQTKRLAEQAVEASEDTKASIDVAKRAADAAERSAAAANAGIASQQATVVQLGFNGGPATNSTFNGIHYDHAFIANIIWVNVGATVARNVNLFLNIEIVDIDADEPDFVPDFPEGRGMNLGTGVSGTTSYGVISLDDMTEIRARRKKAYVLSAATYTTLANPDLPQIEKFVASVQVLKIERDGNGEYRYTVMLGTV